MTEADKRARLEKLSKRLKAGAQVLLDMAAEADAILEDAATPGQQAKRFLDWFCSEWLQLHKKKYVPNGAKDMAQIKRVLKTVVLEDLITRGHRYFRTSEPFVVEAKHPLSLFLSSVNRYAEGSPSGSMARPVGCEHNPPCESDQAHTRRKMADMRAAK